MNDMDIAPDLKERLRACQTTEELYELAKSEGLDLDEDALKAVAGSGWGCIEVVCPIFEME